MYSEWVVVKRYDGGYLRFFGRLLSIIIFGACVTPAGD